MVTVTEGPRRSFSAAIGGGGGAAMGVSAETWRGSSGRGAGHERLLQKELRN